MKKVVSIIISALLVLALCASFTACNSTPETVASKAKVGVQTGTTGEFYAKGDADWGFDGLDVEVKGFDNGGLAVQAMLNGQLDYVIIDSAPAQKLAEAASFSGKIKVIDVDLTSEEYAFGCKKDDDAFLAAVNNIIAEIKNDGRFTTIMNKYFNGEEVEGIVSGTKDLSKADQQLVVSTNAAFAPFEYKIGDKFAGVDIEIAKIIADELGLELVIDDMEFAAVVESVGKNGVDIAMSGLTVKETRKAFVNFTDSYYNASQKLIVKTSCTTFDACTTAEEVENILNNK